ncbi:MAG: D-alanyl-D-alanine carboxypeptidase/D-alanyl-D-alanine-endopeptidase [Saprospiraceae bacterium]
MLIRTICLLLCSIFFLSLSAQKATKKWKKELNALITESEVFQKSFTGFYLTEHHSETPLYEHAADKYYTPASNTKLFTFYTALNILGDTLPTFHYQQSDTAIVFWGTGDPSFLNPYLTTDSSALNFFKNSPLPLHYSNHNFRDQRFGSGWAWDDYAYSYQPERCGFPIYGNVVIFDREEGQANFKVLPNFFHDAVRLNPNLDAKYARFVRLENKNIFECNSQALTGKPFVRERPFIYDETVFRNLLGEASGKTIHPFDGYLQVDSIQTFYSNTPADSLYRLLLQDSDNFVAEQLLLTCSNQVFGTQNTEQIIEYATENFLMDLPDKPIWRDGSGLSRYNLFTPRSIVKLLQNIYKKLPQNRVFALFPAGGESGTIEDWYAGEDQPYVYAKTGTLSNKHCLSGYLRTKSGQVLIFSFMHNNYVDGTKPIKEEMEKVLEWIRENW